MEYKTDVIRLKQQKMKKLSILPGLLLAYCTSIRAKTTNNAITEHDAKTMRSMRKWPVRQTRLQDDYATTAFLCQTEPHAPFPKRPGKDMPEDN